MRNLSRLQEAIVALLLSMLIMLSFDTEAKAQSQGRCGFMSDERSLLIHAHRLADAYNLGKTAMSILIAETHAGRYGPIGDTRHDIGYRSYGPAQIKLATARDIIKNSPRIDVQYDHPYAMINDLIERPYWNVQLMVEHLIWLHHEQDLSWRETLLAYNEGLSRVNELNENQHDYVKKIIDIVEGDKFRCVMNRHIQIR